MAQPDPDLPGRVLASLEDGTPLVTGRRARRRPGRALPRHRQRRLVEPAALRPVRADARAADPERGRPRQRRRDAGGHGLDAAAGARRLRRAGAAEPRRRRPRRAAGRGATFGRDATRHLCERRPAGRAQRHARRATALAPLRPLPDGVVDRDARPRRGDPARAVAARARARPARARRARDTAGLGPARRAAGAGAPPRRRLALAPSGWRWPARRAGRAGAQAAEDEADALYAANETVLAYVQTGNARVDAVSEAGLRGPQPRALRPHRDRAGRAGRGRHRDARTSRSIRSSTGRSPRTRRRRRTRPGRAQRLPALRRHDPVRHPRRRPRRQHRRHHPERRGRCSGSR